MKNLKIVMFIVFITFAFAKSNATSFDGVKTTVTKIQQGSGTPNYVYNNFFNNDIGTDTTGNKTYKARTQYEFDLTTIPSNSTIQNITLTYSVHNFNNGSYKFKITSISTKSTAKDLYNAINGTVLFTDIEYGSVAGSKSNGSLNTLVNNKKGSKMYLGTFSASETTIGSGAQVDLTLELEYSVKFTVDNNFNTSDGKHGKVKIDGTQWTAPYLNTAYTDNTVHLKAIVPQTNSQGHQMIWHTGSIERSDWKRNNSHKSYDKNYNFIAKPDDNGKTYKAKLREVVTTTSGSLTQNETWFTTVNLSGNVTVPSGVTLTLESDAVVNLNNKYIISTGGTIVQQSGSTINGLNAYLKYYSTLKGFFPSISGAISSAGSYYTVELLSKTYNQSISTSKDYFTLKGKGYNSTYVNGNITFTNADHTGIKYLKTKTISTNNSWIDLYSIKAERFSIYGDEAQINYVRTNGGGQIPNQITNADGTVDNSNIENMMIGMDMKSNSAYNVQSYFCGNGADINAFSGSVAYAWYNDAFSYNPDYSCSGNVHYIWKHTCGSNNLAKNGPNEKINSSNKSKDDLGVIDQEYMNLLKNVNDELVEKGSVDMKKFNDEYYNIIGDYKVFLNKYPSSKEAQTAIFRTIHCYQQQDNLKGYDEFINKFLADKKYDAVRPHVERHNIDLNVEEGRYKEAIEVANKIINGYKINEDLYCELLYEKGLIYNHHLNDKGSAEKMFKTIVDKYPKNKMVSYAQIELGISEVKNEKDIAKETLASTKNSFGISNYPNPFNPSTTISYSLPSSSNVKLEIYDVMGRMIKSFTTNSQPRGTHQVVWDGTNSNGARVATGIYIYRFEAISLETNEHFVKSEKLMLVK